MRATLVVLSLAASTACAAETGVPRAGSAAGQTIKPATQLPDACPLTIDGARASLENTGRGISIALATGMDQLMLLRARAHGIRDEEGGLLAACPCTRADAPAETLPPTHVTVDDTEGGVRVNVGASDPDDARLVQTALRRHLGHVHGGDCAVTGANP